MPDYCSTLSSSTLAIPSVDAFRFLAIPSPTDNSADVPPFFTHSLHIYECPWDGEKRFLSLGTGLPFFPREKNRGTKAGKRERYRIGKASTGIRRNLNGITSFLSQHRS